MPQHEWESLHHRLAKKYEFSFFSLEFQGEKFDLATVTNVDQLYDELIAKGPEHEDFRDERIPYWADLWHSGIGLADYILQSSVCKDRTVLEIGCGLGLPGIAAARAGGKVTLTDYLPEPLAVAEMLWKMNLPGEPDLQQLDWRNPDPALAAEVLLASDVLYEERNMTPLLEVVDILMKPGGTMVLSDPGRPMIRTFIEKMEAKGFSVSETQVNVPFREVLTRVFIFEIRQK